MEQCSVSIEKLSRAENNMSFREYYRLQIPLKSFCLEYVTSFIVFIWSGMCIELLPRGHCSFPSMALSIHSYLRSILVVQCPRNEQSGVDHNKLSKRFAKIDAGDSHPECILSEIVHLTIVSRAVNMYYVGYILDWGTSG